MEPIRIGVIGAGNIARAHLTSLSKLKEFQVVAIADNFLPAAEEKAQQFNIPHVYNDSAALLSNSDVDAVVICVPNKLHAPVAIQALQANKHVLVEKPMGINAQAAKEIVLARKQTDKILLVTHQRRWELMNQSVKQQVEKGALGQIYHAKTGWLRRKGIPGWGTWFTQMSESGGGPLIDIGVHMLDLTLYLMGNPKPVSVFGATYAEFGPKKRGIGTWGKPNWDGYYDVEDLATALIRMEDGSTLTLDVSWAVHSDTDAKPYIHLMGTEGGASVRGGNGKLLTEQFDQAIEVDIPVKEIEDESSQMRMYRHFAECVREGKEPISNAITGYTNNLILEAIYESSRTGQIITLDWSGI